MGEDSADTIARAAWHALAKKHDGLRIADPGPGRIFDDRVYTRGACTLHALRLTLGDERFFAMLRDWHDIHRGTSTDTAVFIAHAGRSTPATSSRCSVPGSTAHASRLCPRHALRARGADVGGPLPSPEQPSAGGAPRPARPRAGAPSCSSWACTGAGRLPARHAAVGQAPTAAVVGMLDLCRIPSRAGGATIEGGSPAEIGYEGEQRGAYSDRGHALRAVCRPQHLSQPLGPNGW
ncbi:hypothetical protein [Streptomyces sp. NPDC007205]|uniref:hypothetical protein n=1 Tax=Streptomyces sp. NPDC007205 TaxID=3154316 RepID=UPI0033CDD0C8